MINNQELLFIVDKNNQPLEPKPRDYAHKHKLWHRTTGIWVVHNRQILCQKRSLKKDVKPGFWEAFFGGHLAPNEEYIDGAVKEVNEELGLTASKKDIVPYKILPAKGSHEEFQYICAVNLKEKRDDFSYEEDEIEELQWRDIDELKSILVENKLPTWVLKPWDEEVIKWIEEFFMKK